MTRQWYYHASSMYITSRCTVPRIFFLLKKRGRETGQDSVTGRGPPFFIKPELIFEWKDSEGQSPAKQKALAIALEMLSTLWLHNS